MKKCFSLVLVFILMYSLCAVPALAAGESGTENLLCPECGETLHVKVTNAGIYQQYEYKCAACGYVRNEESLLGFEKVDGSSATPVQDSSSLSGYSEIQTGKPLYTQTGTMIVYPVFDGLSIPSASDGFYITQTSENTVVMEFSGEEGRRSISSRYTLTAPVTGTYIYHLPHYYVEYIKQTNKRYSRTIYGTPVSSDDYTNGLPGTTNLLDLEGEEVFLGRNTVVKLAASSYYTGLSTFIWSRVTLVQPAYFEVIPFDSSLDTVEGITINGIQFNGNIHIDPTLNLTFIYPEYNVTDDNGDTQVNISDNPIIYNEETNQFYTYDSETNNYYYIIVPGVTPTPSPTPSPSPAPSPTPGPGETPGPDEPTPTPTPGGAGDTPGGGDSGGDGGSGGGILGWLGELLGDIIKGILGLLFKLVGAIVSFITWLVGKAGSFFPWLPAGCVVALAAGVVIVTILRIIKFILGR